MIASSSPGSRAKVIGSPNQMWYLVGKRSCKPGTKSCEELQDVVDGLLGGAGQSPQQTGRAARRRVDESARAAWPVAGG